MPTICSPKDVVTQIDLHYYVIKFMLLYKYHYIVMSRVIHSNV